ncbi:quinolinate synthase NadA [bacterium]|nr:quinolinate synthase NadA [bacterium]
MKQDLIKEIQKLKKEKKAIVLVHNYQEPDIYEIADFLGDSLELARKCLSCEDAERIIFCGVDFMAESAVIINPEKKVYLPALEANCPMADMVDVEGLLELQKKHPGSATVCYVNSTAKIKAISDICCTSANAVRIVKSLDEKEIIFVPDRNLGLYVASEVKDKTIIPWDGYCYVHQKFKKEEVIKSRENHPDAEIIVHPECPPEVRELADHICSTSQMITAAKESLAEKFIVFTEIGMLHRLQLECPDKKFLSPAKICLQMKKNSLELVRDSLLKDQHLVTVPEDIAVKAKRALQRMLDCK